MKMKARQPAPHSRNFVEVAARCVESLRYRGHWQWDFAFANATVAAFEDPMGDPDSVPTIPAAARTEWAAAAVADA